MEHEEAYVMMMEALDGAAAPAQRRQLQVHLGRCDSCRREWQALLAIDLLFRQTPALSPAADFAQRTLARLPNRRYRVWLIGAIYGLLLLSGAVPLVAGIWAISQYGAEIGQPAFLQVALESLGRMAQVAGALLGALLSGIGELVAQQPAVVGWLLVMMGVVSVWTGVYRHLVGASGWQLSRAPSVNRQA